MLRFRRQGERPGRTRNIPPDVLADPQRRFEAWRHSWQVRFWAWAMPLVGLGVGI